MKKAQPAGNAAKIWQMLEKELADSYMAKLKKEHKFKSIEHQESSRMISKKKE